jgi:hypothetical protein
VGPTSGFEALMHDVATEATDLHVGRSRGPRDVERLLRLMAVRSPGIGRRATTTTTTTTAWCLARGSRPASTRWLTSCPRSSERHAVERLALHAPGKRCA